MQQKRLFPACFHQEGEIISEFNRVQNARADRSRRVVHDTLYDLDFSREKTTRAQKCTAEQLRKGLASSLHQRDSRTKARAVSRRQESLQNEAVQPTIRMPDPAGSLPIRLQALLNREGSKHSGSKKLPFQMKDITATVLRMLQLLRCSRD